MEDKYIVAIEIGSSKIRGALGTVDNNGYLNVIAVQEERQTDAVRYGQVKNTEETARAIVNICEKLENAKGLQNRRIASAYVGLSGLSVGTVPVQAETKFGSEIKITAEILEQLKRKAAVDRFSEKDIYEIVPVEYMVDNEVTMKPSGCFGSSIKGSYKLVQGNPGIKSNLNRVFPDRLEIDINGYIVSALAQADLLLTSDEKRLGAMLVDFGAETTTLVIFKGGTLSALVTLPMGSRNITRDIVSLNFLEEQAESLKKSIGIVSNNDRAPKVVNPHIAEHPEIVNFISARAGEIISNVLAQVEYAGLETTDLPAGIVITGGGCGLKGLSDMLADQSHMKVRMGTLPSFIRISDSSVNPSRDIDVIALLARAAELPEVVDCLATIPQPETQPPVETGADHAPLYVDDNISRIGHLDDDDIDYVDSKPNNTRKPVKPQPVKPHGPKNPTGSDKDFLARIKGRISDFFRDDNGMNDDWTAEHQNNE